MTHCRMLRRPYSFCSYKKNRGRKIRIGGGLFTKPPVRVGTMTSRCALLASSQVPAQLLRSLDSATGGGRSKPPYVPPPPKMGNLSGLTVGQGAPRPLPLPNTRVQAVLSRLAGTSCSAGGVHRGGCMCLREQTLNASPMRVFLPILSARSERMGPRRVGNFSAEDDCQRAATPGRPYEHHRWCCPWDRRPLHSAPLS